MKLQNLTIIFIIIILPIILVLSAYIGYEIKTINKQNMYNTGLVSATHDAVFSFELNTKNDIYNTNAESKRSNIKAAVKTFENSLSTSCNLGLYNNEEIEEYIPAIVFGLYDGFYMYAPSELTKDGTTTYKHNLRNYVYYSETLEGTDIVIRYTLDNYVAVSGTIDGEYITKAGYLTNLDQCLGYTYNVGDVDAKLGEATLNNNFSYYGSKIKTQESLYNYAYDEETGKVGLANGGAQIDKSAINYFKESIAFTVWFNEYIGEIEDYLEIDDDNDPEDENSPFVQNKRKIMKEKIEETLNSSITAYANKTRNNYKMPKFSEEDWEKVYNNISVISFVQGMNLGFKNYNNYCILNSTNNQEYVNPNLIYFTDRDSYHDIRCEEATGELTGYKIGSFERIKYETTNDQGETDNNYYYRHNELACYYCINGVTGIIEESTVYNYVRELPDTNLKKIAYFSALARERYKTTKLLDKAYNSLDKIKYTLSFAANVSNVSNLPEERQVDKGAMINLSELENPTKEGYIFLGWNTNPNASDGSENFVEFSITENTTLYAIFGKAYWVGYYNYSGDSFNVSSEKVTKNEKIMINYTPPERSGYEFDCWGTNTGTFKNGEMFEFKDFQPGEVKLFAVWKPKLSMIRVTTPPKYTEYYEGDTFKTDGMVVVAQYAAGSPKEVKDYNYTPKGQLNTGHKEIIIEYGGKTCTVSITVNEKVAKIGETYYSSLTEAINSAKNGDTVELLKNVELRQNRIEINKTITLNGNNNTITIDGITIGASGNVTLNDINIQKTPGVISQFISNYGNLTIYSGEYTISGYAVIINYDGTLTIKGGTFTRKSSYYSNLDAAIIQSGTGTTYINGGTIISDKNGVAVTSLSGGRMLIRRYIWDNNYITYGEGYGPGYCNVRYALQIVD